ncbi:MAG: hypothetical protein KJO64_07140, partial [Bacteroidia bacterium]|nr:hypothetical protein [Bacteroidia bacterium]
MKKFIFTLSFILSATCLTFAQWTTSGSNVVLTNTANRVGIGYNSNTDSKLYIFSQSDQHGLKIQNDYLSSATKYGIYNRMNTGGTGTKYGIYNKTDGNSAVTSPVYGIYSTTTVNGSPSNLYGMYSIVNTAGTGNHYAIYGTTNGSSAGNDWAGYFQGRGYFQGNVGIGTNFPTNDLSVTGTANITNTLFIGGTSSSGFPLNILGSASTGILNTNNYSGTSGKFGFRNEVSSDGTGQRWGIQNNVTGNSSSNQDIYGIKNTANSASGSSSDVYGTYNQVSTQGTGNHYAVYGDMNNSAASNDWAGYFEGRGYFSGFLGIGTNTPTEKLDVDGKLRIRDLALDNSKDSILVACGDGTVAYRNFSSMIDSDWTVSGSDIYSSVSGNVGIGTSFPSAKLDVVGDAEINGIEIGKGPGNYFDNTIVGDDALNSNTSGQANSAFGFQCQTSNTTGNFNSAFGYQSLEDNSSGTYNVAMGAFAIKNNTNTWGNVAIGYRALENSSNGYNTSVGYESGRNAGSYGVYIGNRAG